MDGVECLRHAVCRLLHAGELKLVAKYTPQAFQFFSYQGVSLQVVAVKSIIQNLLDVCIVFLPRTPQVKIRCVRMLRV